MGAGEEEKHDQNMLYQVFFFFNKKEKCVQNQGKEEIGRVNKIKIKLKNTNKVQ